MEHFENRIAKIIFEILIILFGLLVFKFLTRWKIPLKIKTERDFDIIKNAGWLVIALIFTFFFVYNNYIN